MNIEADCRALEGQLFGVAGVDKQMAVQPDKKILPDMISSLKLLEIELTLALKSVKTLKRFCESETFRDEYATTLQAKLEKNAPVLEGGVVADEVLVLPPRPPSAAYKFWNKVPRLVSTACAAGPWLLMKPYQEASQLGGELEEKVGQPLFTFIEFLEELLKDFCKWQLDASSDKTEILEKYRTYRKHLQNLYIPFLGLHARLQTLPDDALRPTVIKYAQGVAYAFGVANSRLKLASACISDTAFATLGMMNGFKQVCRGGPVATELDKALELYRTLVLIKETEAKLPQEAMKDPLGPYLSRIRELVHESLGALGPQMLQLTEQEQTVPAAILEKDHIHTINSDNEVKGILPTVVMSYISKRMIQALYFPLVDAVDMQLELVLHAIQSDETLQKQFQDRLYENKDYKAIVEAYEASFASLRLRSDDLKVASEIAYRALGAKDVFGYAHAMQLFLEFSKQIPQDAPEFVVLRTVLASHIQAVAKRQGYPVIYPLIENMDFRAWAIRTPEKFFEQLTEAEDNVPAALLAVSDKERTQHLFESFVFRLLCTGLFASNIIERVVAQIQYEAVLKETAYDGLVSGLSKQVASMVTENSIKKYIAHSFERQAGTKLALSSHEMRLLEEGQIEAFFKADSIDTDTTGIQIVLYKRIKLERSSLGAPRILVKRFIDRFGEAEFERWYEGYEALSRKNALTGMLSAPTTLESPRTIEAQKQTLAQEIRK